MRCALLLIGRDDLRTSQSHRNLHALALVGEMDRPLRRRLSLTMSSGFSSREGNPKETLPD